MSLEDFWKIEKQLDQLKTIALSLDKIHRVRCLEVVRELKNLYEYLDSILFLYCLALARCLQLECVSIPSILS